MQQNNFGQLSREYHKARRGYPDEVFDYLNSLVENGKNKTLDIGCGTGISTRQLKEKGFDVVGSDVDPKMIALAKEVDNDIEYVIASASKLPFEDGQFDVITAFTSFHWFTDRESMNEIRRVLKSDGVFFVALKKADKGKVSEIFREEYVAILKKYVGDRFDTSKDFFPLEVLKNNVFRDVVEKDFYIKEAYTVDEALTLLQSFSFWNLVPDEKKQFLSKEIKDLYERHLVEGFVVRDWEIQTVVGCK